MKEKILKSKAQFIVTYAAIALMGCGLLLATMPVSADDGTQHPHFLGKHFRRHHTLAKQQQSERIQARKHRTEVIAGFLGISEEDLVSRIEDGDTIQEIAQEQGKTRKDFRAYILDYMKEHRLRDDS
jgi:hypothetical protein